MIVYGEYLFVENMIVGMVILFFTGKFMGENIGKFRFIFCGICCGLYAFVLFISISGMLSFAGKLLFSMMIVRVAFGKRPLVQIVEKAVVFFLFTVMYGGIALAMLTSFGWTGVTAVSGIYLPMATYVTILAAACGSAWLIRFFLQCIKAKRMEQRVMLKTEVKFGHISRTLMGLIDSGNALKEPITGNPVCIVRKSFMDELLKDVECAEFRYTVIPYQAVGVAKGILEGYRADWISAAGYMLKSPVLAFCEDGVFLSGGTEFDMLLPGIMLERGIHGDYSSAASLDCRKTCMEEQTCILHRRE